MFSEKSALALLEFLRNLTPQILLLSVALVLGAKLDTTRFQLDLQGVKNAGPFVALVAVLLLAFLANMLVFLERMLEASEKAEIEIQRMASRKVGLLRAFLSLWVVLWRHDKPFLVRTSLALVVVVSGAIALLVSATGAAVQLLRASGAA